MHETESRPISALIGQVLVRVVVPAWILTGAIFKLIEASPSLLPRYSILDPASRIEFINLEVLLATLIGLEITAAMAMIFLPRIARLTAIFMLACFCAILINEIRNGATSCGCFGGWSPPPELMLAIDGALLVGVLAIAPGKWKSSLASTAAMILLSVCGFVASFALVLRSPPPPVEPIVEAIEEPIGDGTVESVIKPAPTYSSRNPSPLPLPSYWYMGDSEIEGWAGSSWHELNLIQLMPRWPKNDPAIGTRYLVFYRRSCSHCEEMFHNDFAANAELSRHVVAIEIPEDTDRLRDPDNAWPMPEIELDDMLELPVGTDWIVPTPLTIKLVDGRVTCVEPEGHRRCMGLE